MVQFPERTSQIELNAITPLAECQKRRIEEGQETLERKGPQERSIWPGPLVNRNIAIHI